MALTTRRGALTTLGTALGAAVGAAAGGVIALPAGAARAADGADEEVGEGQRGPRPLWRAHAHNDYAHPRPLLDALDHRFGSVEADVHLVDGRLLVGHDPEHLDPSRTLEALYLDPLAALVRARHGRVYRHDRRALQLLVDLKTEGSSTYLALDARLRRHAHLFTTYAHGRVRPGAVTAVVSGDRAARAPMAAQRERRAFYDGRLTDLGTAAPASFAPLISGNWTLTFTWRGVGPFPPDERRLLRDIVETAHARGQRVRFWATEDTAGPARDAVWTELLAAGVDHLNTDDLAGLEAFLDARRTP